MSPLFSSKNGKAPRAPRPQGLTSAAPTPSPNSRGGGEGRGGRTFPSPPGGPQRPPLTAAAGRGAPRGGAGGTSGRTGGGGLACAQLGGRRGRKREGTKFKSLLRREGKIYGGRRQAQGERRGAEEERGRRRVGGECRRL